MADWRFEIPKALLPGLNARRSRARQITIFSGSGGAGSIARPARFPDATNWRAREGCERIVVRVNTDRSGVKSKQPISPGRGLARALHGQGTVGHHRQRRFAGRCFWGSSLAISCYLCRKLRIIGPANETHAQSGHFGNSLSCLLDTKDSLLAGVVGRVVFRAGSSRGHWRDRCASRCISHVLSMRRVTWPAGRPG